jgi:hypothetical protein
MERFGIDDVQAFEMLRKTQPGRKHQTHRTRRTGHRCQARLILTARAASMADAGLTFVMSSVQADEREEGRATNGESLAA